MTKPHAQAPIRIMMLVEPPAARSAATPSPAPPRSRGRIAADTRSAILRARKADLLVQQRRLAVRHEAVGQTHAQDPRGRAPISLSVSHTADAEAARQHALLDGHEQVVLGRQLRHQARVDRLGEARIRDRHRDAARQLSSAASSAFPTPLP